MSEPLSTGATSTAVTGVALSYIFTHTGVISGAFTGAVLFVLIANDYPVKRKLGLLVASFLSGIYSAEFVSTAINHLTPNAVLVSAEFGALVASSLVVLLLSLIHWVVKDPNNLVNSVAKIIRSIRGGGYE